MFDFQDLFQWDRFITPTIIKTFYWLVIALISLLGISGIFSGLAAMAGRPLARSATRAECASSNHIVIPSFRDGLKDQTRNLEIPGSVLTHRPGMTPKR